MASHGLTIIGGLYVILGLIAHKLGGAENLHPKWLAKLYPIPIIGPPPAPGVYIRLGLVFVLCDIIISLAVFLWLRRA